MIPARTTKIDLQVLPEILDRIPKELESVAITSQLPASPLGMLCRVDESFWMWHQPKDSPGSVAQASNVGKRAVWIQWVFQFCGQPVVGIAVARRLVA